MAEQRSALVTGSSGGLGLAIAESLAAAGYNIMLHGMGSEQQEQVVQQSLIDRFGIEVNYVQADFTDISEVDRLMRVTSETIGSPDIVVNNAVVRHFAPAEKFSITDWHRSLAVNLTAPFRIIQHALPSMRSRNFGRIINLSSQYGQRGSRNRLDYVTTKTGILGLTRTIALETAGTGITCNAVSPGTVLTSAIEARIVALASERKIERQEAIFEYMKERQPSGRFVEAQDVGAAITFLCGHAARDITGAVIPIDGGWSAA